MGDTEKKVVIKVEGKDDGASALFDKLAMKAKGINKENRLSGENALESALKGGVGKFGLELLGGGAAAIGIDFAADQVSKLADGITKIRGMVANGAGAGEIADQLARSLPIVGDLWTAGRKLRDSWTGEADEIAAINKEAERMLKIYDMRLEASRKEREELHRFAQEQKDLQTQIDNLGKSASEAQKNTLKREVEKLQSDDARKAETKARFNALGGDDLKKTLNAQVSALNEWQKKIDDANNELDSPFGNKARALTDILNALPELSKYQILVEGTRSKLYGDQNRPGGITAKAEAEAREAINKQIELKEGEIKKVETGDNNALSEAAAKSLDGVARIQEDAWKKLDEILAENKTAYMNEHDKALAAWDKAYGDVDPEGRRAYEAALTDRDQIAAKQKANETALAQAEAQRENFNKLFENANPYATEHDARFGTSATETLAAQQVSEQRVYQRDSLRKFDDMITELKKANEEKSTYSGEGE